MQAITNPNHIAALRLFTLIQGARLEAMGMRRKGMSCLAILKKEYKLKGSRAEIILQARALHQDLLAPK